MPKHISSSPDFICISDFGLAIVSPPLTTASTLISPARNPDSIISLFNIGLFSDIRSLDIPYPPSGKEGDFAYVMYPKKDNGMDYELVKLSKSFPAKMWADMYWQYKWQAHVFCPREAVLEVSRAAREVIESHFKIKLNDLSQTLCHIE